MDRPLPKKKKLPRAYLMGGGLVLALAAGVVFTAGFDWDAKVVDEEKIRTAVVRQGNLVVDVAGSGRIMPLGVEWVVAKMPGVVTKVHAEAGDVVKVGQLLVELSNPETDAQLAQKEARLMEAKAALSSRNFELLSQEMQFQSTVVQAKFNYETDKVAYEAYRELMESERSPISRLEFLKSRVAFEKQHEMYEVAKGQFENFKRIKAAQLAEFQSGVRLAEHERDQYMTRVRDLRIVATKDGSIQDFELKVGQPITAGQNLGKIVAPDALFVRLELPAIDAYKLAKGQAAKIQIGREFVDGVVTRIDPNIKGTTIEVDVRLVGTTAAARVDMFVNARVIVSDVKNTLIVARPPSAVENGVSKVYRLDGGSRAELVSVRTGTLSSNEMQVLGGL
jgi:multidrug efflux pump subunit AcrA (membrane-fusion protein)